MASQDSPKVILVDDEVTLGESIAKIFIKHGFSTVWASSADEAEKILATTQIPLMLCDVNMPGRTGLQLLASIRASGTSMATVMVTAEEHNQLIISAMQLGAIDYVVKPFDIEVCLQKLPGWIDLGQRLLGLRADAAPQTADAIKAQLRMIELMRLKNYIDDRADDAG